MSDTKNKPDKEGGEWSRQTSLSGLVDAPESSPGVEPEYLAKLSHRMRNAMNVIVGYSELVAEVLVSEESGLERELGKIVDSAHDMVELVGDIEKAIETARARQERADVTRRLAERLNQALTPDQFVHSVVDSLGDLFACDWVELWLEDQGTLTCVGASPRLPEPCAPVPSAAQNRLFAPLFSGERTHEVSGAAAVDALRELYGEAEVGEWVAARIDHDDELLGALVLRAEDAVRLGEQKLRSLEPVCAQLGIALGRSRRFDQLVNRAHRDPLTGYLNRRRFFELASAGLTGAQAADETIALLMLDIDHFKDFNDTFGHQLGDEVLKLVSRSCAGQLRDTDLFGRFGGEEFIVLARHVDSAQTAHLIAERLRNAVASLGIAQQDQLLSVTVSIGYALSEPGAELDELIGRADSALYAAKHQGRNRVVQYADVNDTLEM
ncbi:diguanylate cyclase [Persicimonas caeni]|uniref:Diguanylate cyclase n=1 Tax=Persicimonas caeni TaxID=2292766 RepID=A0A4Y6PSS5_PERCE|nr:diguanylate cyclase [Persicimonas caeni]QDG51169.1 diguanylate cyclase [Persicimonas caeni]QED32390.1 diguanylate cyclase [Persicimonas caeni]